jgi:hypothetical protein
MAVRAFLARARRRAVVLRAIEGAAIGTMAASMVRVVFGPAFARLAILAGLLLAALWIVSAIRRWRGTELAAALERRAPGAFRNLLITAWELDASPHRAMRYAGERVCRDAAAAAGRADLRALIPLRRAAVLAAAAAVATAVTIAVPETARPGAAAGASAPGISSVSVTIVPPAYTRLAAQDLHDPDRLEILAGSNVRLVVRAAAAAVRLESPDLEPRPLTPRAGGVFEGSIAIDRSGYLALQAVADPDFRLKPEATLPWLPPSGGSGAPSGGSLARRLIPVTVTPDGPPLVDIRAPARDLVLPEARAVDVHLAASDDFGLQSVSLRYTKVSGSGENFTFTEGDLPVQISREPSGEWRGRAALPLTTMGLERGDQVIYRAAATDNRPGAPHAFSPSFIVEIGRPGLAAAEGFAIAEEHGKYALSQQMVIVKTERLHARRPGLDAETVARETSALAAEQRMVRAEFVFMMGGEFEDEAVEAEAAAELGEGRLENRGQRDLIAATRAMSRAAGLLTAADTAAALVAEKEALAALQRAFSRNRYILRTFALRARVDAARRLAGDLSAVADWRRVQDAAVADARTTAVQRVLTGVASLRAREALAADQAADALRLAEACLRVDASSSPLQQAATALTRASRAISAGEPRASIDEALQSAADQLVSTARATLAPGAGAEGTIDLARLRGAMAGALRGAKR